MSFRVPGKIIERTVRLGATVRKGQAIAHLDPVDAQKRATAAEATLDAAEPRVVFARQQFDRDTAQSARNLIATNQLEQSQTAFSTALAAREQAAAELVVARNNVQYTTLFADHDGVITSENAETGQVVAAGQAVFGLAWSGDVDVVLDAAASHVEAIAAGQTASVELFALPGERFDAVVREISPSADAQSRSYRVKLTLSHPAPSVRLGMTGEAVLAQAPHGTAEAAKRITVPAAAIFHRGNEPAVWVVRPDSMLELRPVIVSSYAERSAVVASGLKDGDIVLSAGVHNVHEGELVKVIAPLFSR
jgi:RND family efflux transporter MFP subunit